MWTTRKLIDKRANTTKTLWHKFGGVRKEELCPFDTYETPEKHDWLLELRAPCLRTPQHCVVLLLLSHSLLTASTIPLLSSFLSPFFATPRTINQQNTHTYTQTVCGKNTRRPAVFFSLFPSMTKLRAAKSLLANERGHTLLYVAKKSVARLDTLRETKKHERSIQCAKKSGP